MRKLTHFPLSISHIILFISIITCSCKNTGSSSLRAQNIDAGTSTKTTFLNNQSQDTLMNKEFLDNFIIQNPNSSTYVKPYKMIYMWGAIEVTDLNGRFLSKNSEVAYSFSLTTTQESTQRQVLIYQVQDNGTRLSRTYFLDSKIKEENIPISAEFSHELNSQSKMTVWKAYRYRRSSKTNNIEKLKVNIVLHSKNDALYMIQITEPFKNIFTYTP